MAKLDKVQKAIQPVHAGEISITQPRRLQVGVEVAGHELIQNCFSQKAIEQMLKKHMGISVQREAKKPREVIEQATIYNCDGRVCIPPTAFKKAMLTASTQLKSYKKTQLRTALFIEGNSVPITFAEMVPRMDMVRTSGMSRTPDVRFRPSFLGWKARLIVTFSDTMQVQSVIDLIQRAGTVGVGEWRPEKDGTAGTFTLARALSDPKELREVAEICSVPLRRPTIPAWAMDADIDPTVLAKLFDTEAGTATEED